MKSLDHLSYFLGLEVLSDCVGYYLSQAKYTTNLSSHVVLLDNKTINIPLEANVMFSYALRELFSIILLFMDNWLELLSI